MTNDILQSTTQQFLDIHDITNNILIMKDGTASLIIGVDAMNFGLLAEEEQDAVMYAYAGLLNSLNYPIQIVIRSQTKDVTSYLKLLEEQENTVRSEIIRKRIKTYREFVSNLIKERNVLDKKFYVVVPASGLELGLLSASSVIPGKQTFDITSVEKSVIVEKALNLLEPKRDHLMSQFARIGLYSKQLTTQEIIQLFYASYNPEATDGQAITDSSSYTTPLVQPSLIQDAKSQQAYTQFMGQQPTIVTTTPEPIADTSSPLTPQFLPEQAPSTQATQEVTTASQNYSSYTPSSPDVNMPIPNNSHPLTNSSPAESLSSNSAQVVFEKKNIQDAPLPPLPEIS